MTRYNKFFIAVLGAIVATVTASVSDGEITRAELVQVAIAGAAAIQVWVTANVPTLTWAKTASHLLMAALALLLSWVTGHDITQAEWWNLIVIGLTSAGVYVVANTPPGPIPGGPVGHDAVH